MTERLYIDNTLVDVGNDTDITLSIVSNLFSDLSKIAGNTTYTVKLPKTVTNRRLFGYADRMDERAGYPYRTHTARFFRDGVELIKDGRAVLTTSTNEAYEIVITWGVSTRFAEIVDRGWTLQDLPSTAVVQFDENNDITPYNTFMANGYGYAGVDTTDNDDDNSAWRTNYDIDYNNRPRGNSGSGGTEIRGGIRRVFADWTTRHPSATVKWVLQQIESLTGISFRWTGNAKSLIESLCIPCVTKEANALSYQGNEMLTAVLLDLPMNRARTLESTFSVGASSPVFGNIPAGTQRQRVDVLVTTTVHFTMSLSVWMMKTNMAVRQGSYNFPATSVKLIVIHSDNTEDEYLVGSPMQHRMPVESVTRDRITEYITGEGDIDLVAGDKICVRAWTLISDQNMLLSTSPPPDGISGGFSFTTKAGKEVPYGGKFPIVQNLPKIKIVDFVKFLSAITGTFAKDIGTDAVEFIAFDDAGDIQRAVDWSSRLIAANGRNLPASVAYKISDWAHVNWYRWKSDEKVTGIYDGAITIDDDTLDGERDAMVFPFAASDGNVPIYRYEWEQADSGEWVRNETYSKCEPRIMQIYAITRVSGGVETEYPLTRFGLNMATVIGEKYGLLQQLLNGCKVIEETVRISNAELSAFDETRPVWLAQYGAYWMVTEIRARQGGTADVKLVKLNDIGGQ